MLGTLASVKLKYQMSMLELAVWQIVVGTFIYVRLYVDFVLRVL